MQKTSLLLLSFLFLYSCKPIVTPIAGSFNLNPIEAKKNLSPAAKKMLDDIFKGINLKCLTDYHVHAVGLGAGETNIWVNPEMLSYMHPYKVLQYNVYMSASGITDLSIADQQYIDRLLALRKAEPRYGKIKLLAFDYHHDETGKPLKKHSSFYIPNDYVWKISQLYPEIFEPTISVHPYRTDAVDELEKWGKKGVKMIKWLPNAMRIDASSDKLTKYYETMKKYGMALLTHTGHEKAVEGEEFQKLGNPLLFRKPLDMGIKVLMAHMASLGECSDFDNGNKMVSCFDLFWKMFQNKKYDGLLFGEISGVTIYTRVGRPIDVILEHPEYHHRIVNGSDYPLPAINILYRTSSMRKMGYLTKEEEKVLNEIYSYNPLVFDFALKRTLKHPKTGQKYLPATFETPPELGCSL